MACRDTLNEVRAKARQIHLVPAEGQKQRLASELG